MMRQRVVARARAWIGTPYRHGARTMGAGCDCLGLLLDLYGAFCGPLPGTLEPYGPGWRDGTGGKALQSAARLYLIPVGNADIQPGDVVLFRFRRDLPAKHCAIVSAPNRFIHAYERVGVIETVFTPWWRRHIAATFALPINTDFKEV
jgi:NlpC/P60 family putative phage cell wall peptidase